MDPSTEHVFPCRECHESMLFLRNELKTLILPCRYCLSNKKIWGYWCTIPAHGQFPAIHICHFFCGNTKCHAKHEWRASGIKRWGTDAWDEDDMIVTLEALNIWNRHYSIKHAIYEEAPH